MLQFFAAAAFDSHHSQCWEKLLPSRPCALLPLPLPFDSSLLILRHYNVSKRLRGGLSLSQTVHDHVLRNPGLTSLVRGFALHQCWGHEDPLSKSQGIDDAIQEVVSRSRLPEKEQQKWTGSLENGDQDAYVALLLLSSMPNLERLDLVLPATLDKCCKTVVNSAAMKRNENIFQPQPAFSSLRELINHCSSGFLYTSPRMLSRYLRLPSLREFSGHNISSCHEEKASDDLATLEPATVPLVHLELRASRLNMIDMTNILRAFKHLKTFVYEVGWGNVTYSSRSTPNLGEALSWTEKSLENLWLNCKNSEDCWCSDGHVAPVRTLSSFKVLKNLRVNMYIFLGIEGFGISSVGPDQGNTPDLVSILPASIETLYFSHTECNMKLLTSALEKLLQAKESCTPKLRTIAFEADITEMDDAFDYSRLYLLAGEGGVDIANIDTNREERGRGKDASLTASILSGLSFRRPYSLANFYR